MNAVAQEAFSDRMPSKLEIENADQLRTIMAGIIRDDGDTTLNLVQEKGRLESITLTPAIARTFLDVLRLISSGRGFRLIPVDAELTTQQAADLLNVSRPFLIKLLEEQKIPWEAQVTIGEKLPCSEMMFCAILSNVLENAMHAVQELPESRRRIELSLSEKAGHLLLMVKNPVQIMPVFTDGIPVTERSGHGLGVRSIVYYVEKLNGQYQFRMEDEEFVVRLIF